MSVNRNVSVQLRRGELVESAPRRTPTFGVDSYGPRNHEGQNLAEMSAKNREE